MRHLIIDTDAGIDDAQALMMALVTPDVQIAAITTVSGNCHVDQVNRNVAKVLDMCDCDVPFYPGAPGPLIGSHQDAAHVHGDDGLGNAGLSISTRQPEREHAVHTLLRLCDESPGKYMLITLGPLTNIALAARLDPSLPLKIAEIIIMGGAVEAHGNISMTAEYNVYADPEAAHIVFDTFPMVTLVGWEATMAHGMSWDWYDRWTSGSTEKSRFMAAITRQWMTFIRPTDPEYYLPDPLAMAVAMRPELVQETIERYGTVELAGTHTRGQTVIDWTQVSKRAANVRIIRRVNIDGFRALLEQSVI